MESTEEVRRDFIAQVTAHELADLLNATGNSTGVLRSSLCLALRAVGAGRGMAFERRGQQTAAVGYTHERAREIRRRLSPVPPSTGLALFSGAGFTHPCEMHSESPVHGMAGVIASRNAVYVLAIERLRRPFDGAGQHRMAEAMLLVRKPLQLTAELTALRLAARHLTPERLPLDRLKRLPQIAELEFMLIEEALKREHGNKRAAAAVLGCTREGLRKKIERLTPRIPLASIGA